MMKKMFFGLLLLVVCFFQSGCGNPDCISGDCTDGQGIFTFQDGRIYEGQWKNGKFHGQGTFIFPNGDIYEGQWKDGERNGRGVMLWSEGVKYAGQWKDGKRHGHGTITYPDIDSSGMRFPEEKYAGEWKDDQMNGRGAVIFWDGRRCVGQWKEGKFINNLRPCKAEVPRWEQMPTEVPKKPEKRAEAVIPQQTSKERIAAALQTTEVPKKPEKKAEAVIPQHTSKERIAAALQGNYPYTVHVSSFQKKEKSNHIAMKLRKEGLPAFTCPAQIPGKPDVHRIFVGYYRSLEEARKAALELKGQKDLFPLEAKMPYAIQIDSFSSDQGQQKMEKELLTKTYLAYNIPDRLNNKKSRLLAGAFRTEKEAARFSRDLQKVGFEAKVVQR